MTRAAVADIRVPKICEALRPFKLKPEDTPTDLRSWIEKFRTYYSTSRFDLYNLAEQHMFFFSNMTVSLETVIREADNYNAGLAVLDGDDCLVTILQDEFRLKYPIFNRRLDFFRYQQAPGQKFTDYMLNLKQRGEEADLGALGIEGMYVFRYFTGVTDVKLRERLLKLENPTLEDLKREARAYEVGSQAAKAMDQDFKEVKASQVTDRNKNLVSKYPSGRKPIPDNLKGVCHRCGSKEHTHWRRCPKKSNEVQCTECKKLGHVASVCYKKHVGSKAAQITECTSDNEGSVDTNE